MRETIYFQIKSIYHGLRPSEQKVADFILNYHQNYEDLSLPLIEKSVGVSQPTIVRFVKALNFHSFKQFKYSLLKSEDTSHILYGFNIQEVETLEDIPSFMIATHMSMLEDTLQYLKNKELQEAIMALHNAEYISIYAVENSSSVAYDLMTKLLYLGKRVMCFEDYYLQNIDASHLNHQDVAIGISYSGNSVNTVETLKIAKQKGAKTISLCNFEDAIIHKYSDISLCTSQKQFLYGDAIYSRTVQTAIVDMLYVGIILCDKDKYRRLLEEYGTLIKNSRFQKEDTKM